jgi:hypothetical protein
MKGLIISVIAFCLLLTAFPTLADSEAGRYKAMKLQLQTASVSVLIIDTKEGHLWVWGADASGKLWDMTYMGKVRPGQKMGDLIESWNVEEKRVPKSN